MRLFLLLQEDRQYLVQDEEYHEGRYGHAQDAAKALLEGLKVMRYHRELVVHEPGKRERERLAADDDVPAHHEHPEQHQHGDEHRAPDGQPRQQQEYERQEVAYPVLQDEYVEEVLAVDDLPEDVPGLDRGV